MLTNRWWETKINISLADFLSCQRDARERKKKKDHLTDALIQSTAVASPSC